MKKVFFLLLFTSLIASTRAAEVTTWVPWYGIASAKTVLQNSYGSVVVKDAISRVGLQLWNIRSTGEVELFHATDADIRWFVDWGAASGVEILLTVVNNGTAEYAYDSFDWRLVRDACYGATGKITANNLLAIVDSLNLAGVDLDLEGELGAGGPFTATDRSEYTSFVTALGDSLHARGKILTIDTYQSESTGGIPSPAWWSDWQGKVDAIHAMGYHRSYWSAPGDLGYSSTVANAVAAGYMGGEVQVGMPMWLNAWAGDQSNTGTTHEENLSYVLNCLDGQTGVTLWDIHHPETTVGANIGTNDTTHAWATEAVWTLLRDIRMGVAPDTSLCPSENIPAGLLDDMRNAGTNLAGGTWAATSDFWSRSEATRGAEGTKVWNPTQDHDMVAQNGTWGDIGKGYVTLADGSRVLQMVVETITPLSMGVTGGVVMNFLPIDPSQDPSAGTWEMAKVGVEADYSSYDSLVVGIRCEAGKEVRITLNSKADVSDYSVGPYGQSFACTGNFEDYALVFADLDRVWGTGTTGFDATRSLRMIVEWVDADPPNAHVITIAGVALDRSVIDLRGSLNVSEPVVGTGSRLSSPEKEFSTELDFDKNGLRWIGAVGKVKFRIYASDGRLLESSFAASSFFSRELSPGLYHISLRDERGEKHLSRVLPP